MCVVKLQLKDQVRVAFIHTWFRLKYLSKIIYVQKWKLKCLGPQEVDVFPLKVYDDLGNLGGLSNNLSEAIFLPVFSAVWWSLGLQTPTLVI